MNPRTASVIIFRILYSSSYTVFFVALLLLLAVTPGDHIYQTVSNHKLGNVFVVGGTYLITGLIAVFIYASRLYTNRTTLAAIPKPYLPIEDGEVSRNVRKMIVKNRQRSALIALQSRPRASTVAPTNSSNEYPVDAEGSGAKAKATSKDIYVQFDPQHPPWGTIAHAGWSGPNSGDLSNLEFTTVVAELPNLIEARAVSLAPSDETTQPASELGGQPQMGSSESPITMARLQRPPSQGLRNYLHHLYDLGVISSWGTIDFFVLQYEYARFSTHALLEQEFRELMSAFSSLLIEMHVVNSSEDSSRNKTFLPNGSEQTRKSNWESVQSDPLFQNPRKFNTEAVDAASVSSSTSSQSVVRHSIGGIS